MKRKRTMQWREGDVVAVELGDGQFGFARVLKSPLMAFYDLRTSAVISAEEVVRSPVVFNVWVMRRAVVEGIWPVIGHVPLEPVLSEQPRFFKQDPITKELSIYYGGVDTPATHEQVEGLECAAVWDPQHIVDRLNDHFARRPNKWVKSLRPT